MRFSDGQVAAILRGPRAFRTYAFPGHPDLKVAERCLSEAELDDIEIATLAEMEDRGKGRKWDVNVMADAAPELHQRILERQTIFRGFYDAETIDAKEPVRFFKSAAELTELDTGTITKLYQLYAEHQQWSNPLMTLDAAGAKELAEAAKKDPSGAVLFSAYDRSTLVRLLIASLSPPSTT